MGRAELLADGYLALAQGLLQLRSGLQTATQPVALTLSSPIVLRVPTPLPSVDPGTELCAAGVCTHVTMRKGWTCLMGVSRVSTQATGGEQTMLCFQILVCDQTRGSLQNKD